MQNPEYFPETRWTLFKKIQVTGKQAEEALQEWCLSYRPPIVIYIKGLGYPASDAEDLAQAFFAQLLSRDAMGFPAEMKCNLRAYIMRSIKNFLRDQWRKSSAVKRGGGAYHDSLDDLFNSPESDVVSQDKAFDQQWALELISRAVKLLEEEMVATGRGEAFEVFREILLEGNDADTDRLKAAQKLDMSPNAFRVTLHRVRKRFRQLLEDEIGQTVSSQEELEEEIVHLLKLWQ